MSKIDGNSMDIVQKNMEGLQKLFPEVFVEGKIDFEKLKLILGEEIDENNEKYSFTWPGKNDAIKGSQIPTKGTLRPDRKKSKNFDTTENLYIEGDNLEVLKLLQKSYNGKIKCIYIDPPYNTGKDFVYKDNFRDGIGNYLEQTGQVDSNGNLLSTNTETEGRYHTNWLNMMYPRLRLARNLLSDDGVIFISIDDTEVSNLRKICDEIFGEGNFIGTINWKGRGGRQDSQFIAAIHEYIHIYIKNKDFFIAGEEIVSGETYNKYDETKQKFYKTQLLRKWGSNSLREDRPNLFYSIPGPNNTDIFPLIYNSEKIIEGRWRWEKNKMKAALENDLIEFVNVDENIIPYEKIYQPEKGEEKTKKYITWIDDISNGTKEVKKLIGGDIFDFPKSTELMAKFIKFSNCEKNDIILDFFSGSATTAHAVMQLNAEDGGNRKFIMVQLPEQLEKDSIAHREGYRTIADIGSERIRRAGEKIMEENPDLKEKLDIGFKYLTLDKSNIIEWNPDFEEIEDNIDNYQEVFVKDRTDEEIIYEIMLKIGVKPTSSVNILENNGKKIYDINQGKLFICLEKDINSDVSNAIIKKRDSYGDDMISSVIFRDSGFDGNDSEKLNVIQSLIDAGFSEESIQTI